MLRLACCFATERGIRVCAPVHDALLIEAPLGQLEETVHQVQNDMAEASRVVLGGFTLRSEVVLIHYPQRYADPRGTKMWQTVCEVLADLKVDDVCGGAALPVHARTPALSTHVESRES